MKKIVGILVVLLLTVAFSSSIISAEEKTLAVDELSEKQTLYRDEINVYRNAERPLMSRKNSI